MMGGSVQVKNSIHVDHCKFCAVAVDGQSLRSAIQDVLALLGDVRQAGMESQMASQRA